MTTQIIHGDNIVEMRKMKENSIDAIITDPPYGLQFMGKDWDKLWRNESDKDKEYVNDNDNLKGRLRSLPDYNIFSKGKEMQDFHYKWGVESLRVAKPGAHLLSFGGTRVHHRMISGLEDAGWEVRDCLMWVYGQGFPKSHNISKAIDKSEGVERDVIGINPNHRPNSPKDITKGDFNPNSEGNKTITAPKSTDAIKWDGWGTALKPSWEPIVLCRKPLTKTIAANVLEWGTGGININGSRIPTSDIWKTSSSPCGGHIMDAGLDIPRKDLKLEINTLGRWPSNLIHDGSEDVVELFPYSKSGGLNGIYNNTIMINDRGNRNGKSIHLKTNANEGSAARFFYCAKPSSKEKNSGLDFFEKKCPDTRTDISKGSWVEKGPAIQSNDHPTVKPIKLLQYLSKLITPPNGVILDPFAGSGSTGLAAREEGFDVIMIEQDQHYCDIIKGRL